MYRKTLTTDERLRAPYPALESEKECAREFGRWYCTRHAGHEGPHVSHGVRPALALWDDERTTDEKKGD